MGITKFGLSITERIAPCVKSGGIKRNLELKSHNILLAESIHMPQPLMTDVVQVSKVKPAKIVPENEQLFEWASVHPKLSFDRIEPESLAMVHMTNYYPKDGKILSTKLASCDANGVREFRPTIHFALNKSVTEHALGNKWQTMDYAIIMPFKQTVDSMPSSKVLGGIQDDFFLLEEVKLPAGSIIIKYNPNVEPHQLKITDAFDDIKLIESSNRRLGETADIVLKKLGYNHYNDAFKAHLGASDSEFKLLSNPGLNLVEQMKYIEENGGIKAQRELTEYLIQSQKEFANILSKEDNKIMDYYQTELKLYDLLEKYGDKINALPKAWQTFCKENNYINMLHTQSPWGKAEFTIVVVKLLKTLGKNSWGENFKQRLIDTLDNIPKEIPEGKDLGLDINKLKKIIVESSTPEIAEKRIAGEMKLKAMPSKETPLLISGADNSLFIDFTMQMFGM